MIGVGISPCFTRQGFTFSPLALFAAGEQGAWYDPSDWSTLYQDSAGTTQVTAVGQPVGRMLDKSGRGNHATQPTAINRPVIQIDGNGKYYLAFNGTNSWMSTAAIDFTATDKMSVFAGVRKLSDAATGMVCELSAITDTNNGTFFLTAPRTGLVSNYGSRSKGTVASDSVSAANYAAPNTAVISVFGDISGDISYISVNSVSPAPNGTNQGTGNFGNYPIYIGARAGDSLFFNGNLYSMVIRGALSDAGQITSAETYANSKTGAY